MKNIPSVMLRWLVDFLVGLLPPPQWRVPVIVAAGVFSGLGLLAFHISNASAYLSNDPKACINCHIMRPQYATWKHSSHARVAVCNDCHVPNENPILKYAFKAMDGTRHAFMFTFRLEPQVIRMHAPGQWTVQNNCIRCHKDSLQDAAHLSVDWMDVKNGTGKLCWDCHREVPHGRGNSRASVPNAIVPQLEPLLPGLSEPKNSSPSAP